MPLLPFCLWVIIWINRHYFSAGEEVENWYDFVVVIALGLTIAAVVIAPVLWLWGRFLVAVGLLTKDELWNSSAPRITDKRTPLR
jgi:hypothetical protein